MLLLLFYYINLKIGMKYSIKDKFYSFVYILICFTYDEQNADSIYKTIREKIRIEDLSIRIYT